MRTKIAFIHNSPTRFVTIDLELLRRHFDVTEIYIAKKRHNPAAVLRRLQGQDLIVGWFASWHTLLPVLAARRLDKPAVLIVGGYDTAAVPAADYGSQRGGAARLVANMAMNAATMLVVNSESARREALQNAGIPADKIAVIYHGIPAFPAETQSAREKLVLTVGGVKQENLLRKGLLPFVETANLLPEARFVLAGKWYDGSIDNLRAVAAPNVTFMGYISDEALNDLYRRAAVYVQASLHEGFGMSVAESMIGGCIPVVTPAGALPEVVGDQGVVIGNADPPALLAGIRRGLDSTAAERTAARERILTHFPVSRREEGFCDLVSSLAR